MSYVEKFDVGFADSPSTDAFGRARVSNTGQRLDVEFLYGKQPEYFDEITTNGTVTWNSSSRDLTLALSAAADGNEAQMASYPIPCTPGNSQLIEMTGVLDLANLGTGTTSVFVRSSATGSVVEEVITQDSWVEASSGVNWDTSHIFGIDFQSLKVGRLRFYLNQSGQQIKIAEVNNDNKVATGYWQLPNQPCYYRVYNTATATRCEIGYGDSDNAVGFRYEIDSVVATATMKAICCTAKSEGGPGLLDLPGLSRSADMAQTQATVSTTLIPLISIRAKSTFGGVDNHMLIRPKNLSLEAEEAIRFVVIVGGTLTGASWSDVDTTYSCVEYDTAASAVSGGRTIVSEYLYADVGGGSRPGAKTIAVDLGKTVLWDRQGSETGILTVAAVRTRSSNSACLCSVNFEEIR